ncbi:CvpA family protein [Butyrivibrio proteoclasticus]|uniref:CvpA family protein n=1 Tax=Butyrivibrio proteoclasticus TaxID=43305 RepID=UPI0009DED2AB|nr:CvpA family protein [Butyrivibrio proteoclasticus]
MFGFDISQLVITIVVICLFMWRMSYGANNGLFAEAAGLIAAMASFAAVYYVMRIVGGILTNNLGSIIPKIGYLVIAFIIYKVMMAIADAFKKIKTIPILGGIDRLFGMVLGFVEALVIIYIVEYITGIGIISSVMTVWRQLFELIQKSFIKK